MPNNLHLTAYFLAIVFILLPIKGSSLSFAQEVLQTLSLRPRAAIERGALNREDEQKGGVPRRNFLQCMAQIAMGAISPLKAGTTTAAIDMLSISEDDALNQLATLLSQYPGSIESIEGSTATVLRFARSSGKQEVIGLVFGTPGGFAPASLVAIKTEISWAAMIAERRKSPAPSLHKISAIKPRLRKIAAKLNAAMGIAKEGSNLARMLGLFLKKPLDFSFDPNYRADPTCIAHFDFWVNQIENGLLTIDKPIKQPLLEVLLRQDPWIFCNVLNEAAGSGHIPSLMAFYARLPQDLRSLVTSHSAQYRFISSVFERAEEERVQEENERKATKDKTGTALTYHPLKALMHYISTRTSAQSIELRLEFGLNGNLVVGAIVNKQLPGKAIFLNQYQLRELEALFPEIVHPEPGRVLLISFEQGINPDSVFARIMGIGKEIIEKGYYFSSSSLDNFIGGNI